MQVVKITLSFNLAVAGLTAGVILFLAAVTIGASAEQTPVQRGGELFRQCSACHQIGVKAQNRIGPHLNNLIGRVAGSIPQARYSQAMTKAGNDGLIWNEETLSGYLLNPRTFLEGTRMSFKGLPDDADRAAIIAYLAAFTSTPNNIPEMPAVVGPADPPVPEHVLAIDGDPAYGEYLSGECVTCHDSGGVDKGIPAIVGWPTEPFVRAMHAYKNKARDNPVMQMITSRLSDEEIAALAVYFESKTD